MYLYRHGRIITAMAVAAGVCFMGMAAASPAATIYNYQDTFSRDGNLIGSAPETSTPAATWSGSGGATYTTSALESKLTVNHSNGDVGVGLPLTVEAGQIASVTVTIEAGGGGSAWMGVGFSTYTNMNIAQGFVLLRGNGGVVGFTGSGTDVRVNGTTSPSPGTSDTFTVTLDNTDALNPTISISDTEGLIRVSNAVFTGDASAIAYVSLMHSTSGTYSNFSASVVPEPASLSVLVIGAMGLLVRRRKRA